MNEKRCLGIPTRFFGKQKALNAEGWLNPVKMSNGKNIAFFPE
jgi:hypothetical protein